MNANERAGYAIKDWCAAAGFSPALYFKRKRQGLGPREVSVGRRTIIIEPPNEYLKRLEDEAAQPRIQEAV